ncbi:MAG: HAMP domain-containing protein [Spirochaetales bacterium]|nr:HAMP domain-containing protein [Spirochaetales bacterium]
MDWTLRSIKTKLIFGVISAVVLLLTVLLVLSYTSLKKYSLNNALELSETILNDTESKINRFFLEIEYLADSLKRNSSIYNVKIDNMKELFISTVYARNEYLRAIYLGTDKGEMYEWGVGEGFIENTPTFPEEYDPRIRPWYKEAIKVGSFAVSEPYIYASINALGITCVTPVYDSTNRFVGVLGLDIILQGLANMIKDLQVQKQGKVILLNQNFEILADQFNEYTENMTQIKTFKDSKLITSSEGYFISVLDNKKMLTSYKTIKSTGGILLVAIPYTEIMEFSNQTLATILLSEIFLMFFLLASLTVLLHKIITEPLGKMLSVMKEIEYGNVDARIIIKGDDEFTALGRLFNQLEDIRREYTESMEKEISIRTTKITSLQQENTRLRIIEEKERIFANLHDSLGARLTNIFISNNVAKNAIENDNKNMLTDMHNRIGKNVSQGIKDLKEIIFGPELGDRVIIDFVKLIGFNIKERLKLKSINFNYISQDNEEINLLSKSLRFEINNLLQEIVSNILKHSEADTVSLNLKIIHNKILIKIEDNGIGFDYQINKETGFGISSIINRIDRLNGTVELKSSKENGTSFKISIPVEVDSK